jgi:hypothetical protein
VTKVVKFASAEKDLRIADLCGGDEESRHRTVLNVE